MTRMSTPPAAHSWRISAARDSSSYVSPTGIGSPMCGASPLPADCSPAAPASPTSLSPCKALGSGAISLFGSDAQKAEWLPKVASGEAIAAYALTEPETGSDAANIAMRAEQIDGEWRLTRREELHHQRHHRRCPDRVRAHRIARGWREGHQRLHRARRRSRILGRRADRRNRPASARSPQLRWRPGRTDRAEGEGFKIAMQTLNLFRVTVGAAAVGFASRALNEAIAFATTRKLGNATLGRQCGDPGEARRHGAEHRRVDAADRPRRLAAGHGNRRQPPRRRHGQAPRDGIRADR